ASVTVNLTGPRRLGPSGVSYAYVPVNGDLDGPISAGEPITSTDGGSSVVVSVPAYSVVVLVFPAA
ncbi:MAG TPA: hypothetical protein VHU40_13505, partial [Polyangia bacterium]|nr:hypothetical protein [Polyangia bacterium]